MADKVKLKLGVESTRTLCQHASLVDVVSAMFGGSDTKTTTGGLPEGVNDLAKGATAEAAIAHINAALNFG